MCLFLRRDFQKINAFLLLFARFNEKYRVFVCVLGREFALHVVVPCGCVCGASLSFCLRAFEGPTGRGGLLSLS